MDPVVRVNLGISQPEEFFAEALNCSFADFGDPNTEKNRAVIKHIAAAMAGYIRSDSFLPNQMRTKLDTVADIYMRAATKAEMIFLGMEVGNFALFMSGMFPEALDNIHYYEMAGISGYSDIFTISEFDSSSFLYRRLARNFTAYRHRINYARDRYMHFAKEKDELVRLVPAPQPRMRGVQQPDGSVNFTFYLPEKLS